MELLKKKISENIASSVCGIFLVLHRMFHEREISDAVRPNVKGGLKEEAAKKCFCSLRLHCTIFGYSLVKQEVTDSSPLSLKHKIQIKNPQNHRVKTDRNPLKGGQS